MPMNPFEVELQKALRREEPSPGFADRVLARVQAAPPSRTGRSRPGRWLAAAAVLVALLTSGGVLRWRHERRLEGERARAQVELALEITSEKLNIALDKMKPAQEDL